jgi:hypothetical protein
MLFRIKNFLSYKNYLPIFIALLGCYFAIGAFLIVYTPMTTDEVAHLSAAHGITTGQDLNLEHPPLLKTLNAIPLAISFGGYKSTEMGQWLRSADFMTISKYDQHDILNTSRSVYLIFNSLLLIWLLFYTCIFKLLPPKLSLLFSIIYVFSPSFYSHNYFITFDVAGSITALMTVVTFGLIYYHREKLSKYQLKIHFLVATVALFLAINTKFSNYLMMFLLIIISGFLARQFWKTSRQKLAQSLIRVNFSILGILMIFTWVLYAISYRDQNILIPDISDNGPQLSIQKNWLTAPVFRATRGFLGSLGRSADPFYNFVGDHNEAITYSNFMNRVFWYKENPGLIVMLAVLFGLFLSFLAVGYVNKKRYNPVLWLKNRPRELVFGIIVFVFPVFYVLSSASTKFTIGYRHFYPALIFIYFGLAFLINYFYVNDSIKLRKYTGYVLIVFYIIYGIIGIPQTYNYVSFLWTKPKWQLTTDSTLSWADGGGWGLRYLTQNNLLQKNASGFNTAMDVYIAPTFPIYVDEALGSKTLKDDVKALQTDITVTRIKDLKVRYLVVDIYSFQKTSNKIYINDDPLGISRENREYLLTHKPIYDKNGVAFVYDLNKS